uniref:Uncharacterized protein n=1 Tax=Vespula pensylvanica TaxID=30213 RepID=A0A834UEX9_VESPE|nr:hypothetical protein H0235_003107 [Vespula pensylvanica]
MFCESLPIILDHGRLRAMKQMMVAFSDARARGPRLKACVLDDPRLDVVFVIVLSRFRQSQSLVTRLLKSFTASYNVQGYQELKGIGIYEVKIKD